MIQTQAMLVNLTINQWDAHKQDKAVAADVDQRHGAMDAGRYNKLLIDKSALEPMSKLAGAMREHHYHLTMPWGDNGDRLLPSTLYMQYTGEMRTLRSQFENATNSFVNNYPTLVAQARTRLGSLYDADDYPEASQLHKRFGVNISFMPVPDAKDFRVDLSKEQVEQIRSSVTETIQARQNEAVRSCYVRAADIVGKISEKLSVKKSVFRDNLIENARSLCELLPAMNITNDPALDEMRLSIEALLVPQKPYAGAVMPAKKQPMPLVPFLPNYQRGIDEAKANCKLVEKAIESLGRDREAFKALHHHICLYQQTQRHRFTVAIMAAGPDSVINFAIKMEMIKLKLLGK